MQNYSNNPMAMNITPGGSSSSRAPRPLPLPPVPAQAIPEPHLREPIVHEAEFRAISGSDMDVNGNVKRGYLILVLPFVSF